MLVIAKVPTIPGSVEYRLPANMVDTEVLVGSPLLRAKKKHLKITTTGSPISDIIPHKFGPKKIYMNWGTGVQADDAVEETNANRSAIIEIRFNFSEFMIMIFPV